MVKAVIYFPLITLSACYVLAIPAAYQRREASDILEGRDSAPTIFSRGDTASLQEREPFIGALLGLVRVGVKVATKVGPKIASRVGSRAGRKVAKHVGRKVERHRNNRRKRDLEAEDDIDLAAREDTDEFVERELDVLERGMNEDNILGREVEEDLYLD